MSVRHLDQHQLSKRWGLSPRTLERWRWLGVGPAYLKLVGSVLYRLEDIEQFESDSTHHRQRAHPSILPCL